MQVFAQFRTELTTCPYLRDRPSQLDVRLVDELSGREHEAALAAGIRHFGRSYFWPVCPRCRRCISIRVPVRTFRPSRSQKRVLRRNSDVQVEIGAPRVDDERIDLYQRFHAERESRRGWDPTAMDVGEYFSSFIDNLIPTLEIRYRLAGKLVAVAYVDETPSALNSVFGFWEPSCFRRSLGTFDVLMEIEEARSRRKDHVYLGYHVEGCRSLEYKKTFRPWEMLVDGVWLHRDGINGAAGSGR